MLAPASGEAVDIGRWAVRSATDENQRELNRQVVGYIWDHPGEAAGAVWSGITDPIAQDWQSGNQGEAIGRAVFDIGTAVAPLTKLATAARGARAAASAGEAARAVPAFARTQYGAVSGAERASVLARTPVCVYCGARPASQLDHISALKRDWDSGGWADDFATRTGRVNSPINLTGACAPCNASKGAREIGTGPGQWWPPGWPSGTWWPFGGY